MPFDQADLIRQTGLEAGDVLPVATINTPPNDNRSTTSTSFTTVNVLGRSVLTFGSFLPVDTFKVAMGVRLEPGAGETMDARFRNDTDGETMVSVTGQAGVTTQEWSGWTDYTPTTTGAEVFLLFQHRVDVGTNSSTSVQPRLYVGVQL